MTRALLIIDMQNDFFDDPALERFRPRLTEACNRLSDGARAAGRPVLEIQTVHQHDRSTCALNMREDDQGMALVGSRGVQRVAGLAPGDIVIEKTRDSAFHRTDLRCRLRDLGVSEVVVAGVSTESCIAMTCAEAYAWDLRATIGRDATASPDPGQHQDVLRRLGSLYRQRSPLSTEISWR